MCGIIISPDKSKIDSIKHRGIQFTSLEKREWIYGHHRLPIQTLEEDNWFQPVHLKDGFLLYNGEIFNFNELHGSNYENDTAYLKDLFDCDHPIEDYLYEINKWDGFWSIVIVRKNKTILFTDPLGKKQLYINRLTGEVSSEVKGLSNSKIIDPIFISTVNKWGYNTDNRTLYEDVQRIMPNNIYIWEKGRTIAPRIIQNYFDWNINIPTEEIHELIEISVKRRLLTKKYKVSTLFSGGLDSTIILFYLKKFGADVNIYSINNEEDGEHVKFMEDHWGLKINYLDVKPEELPLVDRMKIYDINDSMIDLGSVIPQYYLFKDIKDKIVLTGDGADELFGGYRRISEYDSQKSDVFQELPFYHLVRIDRMSMNFTIECRNPFLGHDVVRAALRLPYSERTHKWILKEQYRKCIPEKVIDRKKNPLKIKSIRENETQYRRGLIEDYLNWKRINGNK
jgi:asparagine synthase (glutamine-hydrolysing)